MITKEISALLRKVRTYDAVHADLKKAHHFLFCKKIIRKDHGRNVILMGFNPGETAQDWKSTDGQRSEETCEYDFHSENRTAASKRWMSNVDFYLPDHNVYLTEFFLWSSKNVAELEARYGSIRTKNSHVEFCKKVNMELIRIVRPEFIVFTGVSYFDTISKIYNLTPKNTLVADGNKKLTITASSSSCPWIFTRHWSGSFGLSNSDKEKIRDQISGITSVSYPGKSD